MKTGNQEISLFCNIYSCVFVEILRRVGFILRCTAAYNGFLQEEKV